MRLDYIPLSYYIFFVVFTIIIGSLFQMSTNNSGQQSSGTNIEGKNMIPK